MQTGSPLIIIPAYNEENNIVGVVEEITEKYPQYDYVVINDGSTDATRKVCVNNGINLLDLPVNLGLSGAIRSGMRYANYYGYEYVVQLDGDGQHCPEYIADMLSCMERTGADIVIGSRFKTERKPVTARMIGSQIITYAIWITTGGKYIGDVTSGMRLFNKRMIKMFGYRINYRPEPDTLAFLLNQGVKIEEVQVSMRERVAGDSYLNLKNSFYYMLHVLFNILFFQWVRKD
ncbi:MAG: glycosyltransferase family 2 protein [Lachnospiraceae bacterium]|jgi:glycosyltransferase involved in cell wall biosynthesis|nr:glycosyltransferase family 2 protein [Lachnospiraceae bacterium]